MRQLISLTRNALDLFWETISAAVFPGRFDLSPVMIPAL
jgi:hypothetical protein